MNAASGNKSMGNNTSFYKHTHLEKTLLFTPLLTQNKFFKILLQYMYNSFQWNTLLVTDDMKQSGPK